MKLQFAFGNPRKKRRKKVAKGKKSKKNRSVKTKLAKAVKHMAKRKGRKGRKHVRKGRKGRKHVRKNPEGANIVYKKDGKTFRSKEYSPLSRKESQIIEGKVIAAFKAYEKAPQASAAKSAAYKHLAAIKKEADAKLAKRASYEKVLERYGQEPGVKITKYDLKEKGAKVAKKKKAKKKKAKKSKAKKVKAASKKKRTKRTKRKGAKRGKRKGMSKKAKRAFVARMKKARKAKGGKKRHAKKRASKKRGKRRSRRSKMVTHKHAKSTRHIRRGSKARVSARKRKGSYKIKTHFGRGKKRVRMTGRLRSSKSGVLKGIFKINPFRSNPMTDAIAKFTGLNNKELQLLAIGAAAAPISAALIPKIPGVNTVVGMVAGYIPAKYQAAGINLLLGVALNAISSKVGGQGGKYAGMVGEGLAAASIIQLVSSMATDGLRAAGMGSINYSPSMRGLGIYPQMGIMPQLNGVNYTPEMRGMRGLGDVRYTPQMRGVGSSADFGSTDYGGGGGYTEAHNRSRADFGANFSSDSEAEGLEDQDNSYSSSMN